MSNREHARRLLLILLAGDVTDDRPGDRAPEQGKSAGVLAIDTADMDVAEGARRRAEFQYWTPPSLLGGAAGEQSAANGLHHPGAASL